MNGNLIIKGWLEAPTKFMTYGSLALLTTWIANLPSHIPLDAGEWPSEDRMPKNGLLVDTKWAHLVSDTKWGTDEWLLWRNLNCDKPNINHYYIGHILDTAKDNGYMIIISSTKAPIQLNPKVTKRPVTLKENAYGLTIMIHREVGWMSHLHSSLISLQILQSPKETIQRIGMCIVANS